MTGFLRRTAEETALRKPVPRLAFPFDPPPPAPIDDQVEFVIEKPNKAKFDVGGVLYDKVRLTMVLDGYTAPVTAGTIVDLIQRGERSVFLCIL